MLFRDVKLDPEQQYRLTKRFDPECDDTYAHGSELLVILYHISGGNRTLSVLYLRMRYSVITNFFIFPSFFQSLYICAFPLHSPKREVSKGIRKSI